MNHAPFIWSAYAVAVIVYAWTALAPVWRARRFRAAWQAREKVMGRSRGPTGTSEN